MKRRKAVAHVREALGRDCVSKHQACLVAEQPRSTQRGHEHVPSDEPRLVRQTVEMANGFGYREGTALRQKRAGTSITGGSNVCRVEKA